VSQRRYRVLRAVRADQSGLTLIELLVAVALLGILLTIISGLYVSALRTVTLSREVTANSKMASNAMNESTRAIRAATENPITGTLLNDPAFIVAKPDDILFYAYVNVYADLTTAQQPVMIRLRVDRTTGTYIESRWTGTAASDGKWVFTSTPCEAINVPVGCTAPSLRRTLAATMSPTGTGNPPFLYLNADGVAIANTSSGLSPANRLLVAFVRVSLSVQTSLTDASNPTMLESIVGIPNLGFAK
jgi:prepilin-type N-terminal cleavage/methylation domain-containing protein